VSEHVSRQSTAKESKWNRSGRVESK
jgi:hypothetical protein